MVSGMALTTPTAMACRTDAPADKAAVLVEALVEALVAGPAVDCRRAVVASTRRRGEHSPLGHPRKALLSRLVYISLWNLVSETSREGVRQL